MYINRVLLSNKTIAQWIFAMKHLQWDRVFIDSEFICNRIEWCMLQIAKMHSSHMNYLNVMNVIKQLRITTYKLESNHTFIYKPQSDVNIRSYSTQVAVNEKKNTGLYKRIKNLLGIEDIHTQRLKFKSALLYEKIVDNIDFQAFFEEFNLPDTFVSWFLIMELHVWMVSLRLMADVELGKIMRNEVLEMMWQDVNMRIKKLGPVNSSVKKRDIMLLAEQLNAAFVGYDEGIKDDKILAAAIWRRFFGCECNNPESLEKLVCFVRKQTSILDKMPLMDLLECSKISWENIKTCT